MSNNFNINSERDLAKFLKIVSEESYKKSLRESSYVDNYKEQFKTDSKIYNLSEQEETEPEEQPPDGELVDRDTEEEKVEDPNDSPEDEVPTVSFEAIKSAINDLRASRSLRNQEASDSLSSFYEKLDENEKLVLLSYLNTLTDILNLAGKGQDPSEPPLNIKMSSAEDEADEEAAEDAAETKPAANVDDQRDEEEDTSPPISIDENKNLQSEEVFRRKIRALML